MDNDFVQTIRDKKQQKQSEDQSDSRHHELVEGTDTVQQAVLNMARAIIETNLQHQPQVSVKNFPDQLATSADIEALREALSSSASKAVAKTENGTEKLTSVLEAVLSKLDELVEKDNQNDVTSALGLIEDELKDKDVTVTNLDDLANYFFELQRAVEKLDLSVNVDAPVINVEKPDLSAIKELSKEIKGVQEAIEKLEFPTDERVPKSLNEANKLLTKILTRPIPVSNGGGGSTFQAAKDFDYIGIADTSATVDTLTYKSGGPGGTLVRTLAITFAAGAEKISDSITTLEYS